jgi:hypothetical protein
VSSPGSGFNFAQVADGNDLTTLIKRLAERVEILEKNRNQDPRALGWNVATPAMPTSGVTVFNTYPKPVTLYIWGGTISVLNVDGVAMGILSGTFRLAAGADITITYTVAPSWFWYGD